MKKQILTLTTVLALGMISSCGAPKADKIDVTSNVHESKTVSQFQLNKAFETEVLDTTFITFPKKDDLEGYTYDLSGPTWDAIIVGQLSYGSKLESKFTADMSSETKVVHAVKTILSLGDLKEKSFDKLKKVENKLSEVEAQVLPMIKGLLAQFPCYKLKENKRKCKLSQDETTVAKAKNPKKCSELKRNKKKFVDLTEEEATAYTKGIAQCNELNSNIIQVKEMLGKVNGAREAGRNIGLALAKDYGKYANFDAVVTVNSQVLKDSDIPSIIEFSDDQRTIKKLSLAANFGRGYKEYSVTNGGISGVEFGETVKGTRFLKFSLHGDYRIDATLSVTTKSIILDKTGKSYTDLRLKGTSKNYFTDGSVRKGVIAMQLKTLD